MADQRFAIIRGGLVINVQMAEDINRIAVIGDDVVVASSGADIGFSYSGSAFTPPNMDSASLVAYAASIRHSKEVGGITVNGIPIATDDRSKQMILGARVAAGADSEFTTPWIGVGGAITTLNADQVIAMSNAVLDHVQSCFTLFASVVSGIAGGDITTRSQIDEVFS